LTLYQSLNPKSDFVFQSDKIKKPAQCWFFYACNSTIE